MKLIQYSIISFLLFVGIQTFGQHNPVSFNVHIDGDTIIFNANIESGWHLYAANLPDPTAGPLPTEFVYNDPAPELVGNVIEPKGHTEMDDAFGVEVKYFEHTTYYKQPLKSAPSSTISGTVYYMVCNDEMCIPLEYAFTVSP